MTTGGNERAPEREYLCVEAFLATPAEARALRAAIELGVIDLLARSAPCDLATLQAAWRGDYRGLELLLSLLAVNGVIERRDGGAVLTEAFARALRFRDLIEAKLHFADALAGDLADRFTLLLADPDGFQRDSRLFELFRYDLACQRSPENLAATRRWVALTTALTRYEGPVCLSRYDFSRHRRVLDVGGNSGEFAATICRRHARVEGVVFDLPVVCDIGRDHVEGLGLSGRVSFLPGDALADPWPGGFDLVIFKSMLHDWPDSHARALLARARQALAPGGTLLIFERSPIAIGPGAVPYSLLPMLLLFRSFRGPGWYVDTCADLGFAPATAVRVELETPFFLLTASR
ncbi:MAG: methyltransferase [Planctomycetota bacterium]|nr:methyltransferase [Planctomycetota bacterium]